MALQSRRFENGVEQLPRTMTSLYIGLAHHGGRTRASKRIVDSYAERTRTKRAVGESVRRRNREVG